MFPAKFEACNRASSPLALVMKKRPFLSPNFLVRFFLARKGSLRRIKTCTGDVEQAISVWRQRQVRKTIPTPVSFLLSLRDFLHPNYQSQELEAIADARDLRQRQVLVLQNKIAIDDTHWSRPLAAIFFFLSTWPFLISKLPVARPYGD
jgi:hypothetical protein